MAAVQANSVVSSNLKPQYGKIILSLENCILPPDKFTPTPSYLDGLDRSSEMDLRILGCDLIQTSGILLRLPQVAMATGQVLFQRFYYSKSFIRHNMEIVAMACITLASKIEESPRRIRDVINVLHHIKQVRAGKTIQPLVLDQNYINHKNQVIKAERRILKELGFCVHVKHPHKIIVTLLEVLKCKGHQKLMQTAWNYMNDSLRSDAFVRYHPETIACACIYLSARLLKISLPNKPPWYLLFDVSENDVRNICNMILELYIRKKPDPEKLDKLVDDLKKAHQEAKLKAKGLSGNITPSANAHTEFSPASRPTSPKQGQSPMNEVKRERDENKNNSPKSENNHISKRKRSRSPHDRNYASPHSKKEPKSSSSDSRSESHSPSPKHKNKSPPRIYKSHKSRSRSRSRSRTRDGKDVIKHRSHKKKRITSASRSRSRSPHKHTVKRLYKDKEREKNRHKSRSRSRERNHHSNSYDKAHKSHKDRSKDVTRYRSRSRERGRR